MSKKMQHYLFALLLLTFSMVFGSVISAAPTEDIVYYHNDILGNPLAATDESGNVIWQESYTAYGEKTIEDEASDNNPLAFTGHYQDRESGLVYMGARYYSPELGRFLSPDPADFIGQVESNPMLFNRYAYANNNPYKYVDPDGESPIEIATELLPAAGRSFAALALYANGMISNDQAMVNVALEVMRENQTENMFAIAAVVAPPGAGKAYKVSRTSKKINETCCFVAGTTIVTQSGNKAIELVELGEMVLSKDVETGEQAYKPVTRLYERQRAIYELQVAHANGKVELIETTDDHPFYVLGSGFVDVIDLKPGNQLVTANGEAIEVVSVVNSGRTDTVYNIEVADFHTYYATGYGILVHNCDGVAKSGDKFTEEVIKRRKPGRDGGQSQHVIEKVDGQTTSTTHQVFKDGKTIHQHQDHIGKYGSVRRFSDELTGTKTINAPTTKDTMQGGRLGFPPKS